MQMDEVRGRVKHFLERSTGGHELQEDDDIFAMGLTNSLFAMQLVEFVEGEFGIEVDADDLDTENFKSIAAITSLVARKNGHGDRARVA